MLGIAGDREDHELAEFKSRGASEAFEKYLRLAHDAEIDISRCARALDTEFDDKTAFEHHGVTKLAGDAREESIEHEELTPTREVYPVGRG